MFQPEKHSIFLVKEEKRKRKGQRWTNGRGKWWSKRAHCRPQPGEAMHRVRGKDK